MIEQVTGLAYMLALYGALWVANMFFGISNSLKAGEKFEIKRFFAGWRTAIFGAIGFVFTIGAILFIPQVFQMNGIVVGDDWKNAISLLAIVAGLAGGILTYGKKAVANIVKFVNPENVETKLTLNKDNWNSGSIETITGEKTAKELLEEDGVKTDE